MTIWFLLLVIKAYTGITSQIIQMNSEDQCRAIAAQFKRDIAGDVSTSCYKVEPRQ